MFKLNYNVVAPRHCLLYELEAEREITEADRVRLADKERHAHRTVRDTVNKWILQLRQYRPDIFHDNHRAVHRLLVDIQVAEGFHRLPRGKVRFIFRLCVVHHKLCNDELVSARHCRHRAIAVADLPRALGWLKFLHNMQWIELVEIFVVKPRALEFKEAQAS